jgi:alpha-tubulin suppressor-like RCC1 family protein
MAVRLPGPLIALCALALIGTSCARAGFTFTSPPDQVDGGSGAGERLSGALAVAVGRSHACALDTAGGLVCWGDNSSGELGDGTYVNRDRPQAVLGLAGGVGQVATGESFTCARLDSGGVECWGSNGYGQLGDGSNDYSSAPRWVEQLRSGVRSVDVGYGHGCAVLDTGGVKCWGKNEGGQLGDGSYTYTNAPVEVLGLSSGASAISVAGYTSCALMTSGSVKCWGSNNNGQLGDDSYDTRLQPVDVIGLTAAARTISTGDQHVCAVLDDGKVMCWGGNWRGQLGDGSNDSRPHAIDVIGLAGRATAVAAGWTHTCALLEDGSVQCWGDNWAGQVGIGQASISAPVSHVAGLAGRATAIATGYAQSCAVLEDQRVQCWGSNQYGALGNGQTGIGLQGMLAPTAEPVASSIGGGGQHTCVVTASGGVLCAGANASGQLGDGSLVARGALGPVSELADGMAAVVAGGAFSCALTSGGGVKCWGADGYGQLGDLNNSDQNIPVDVNGMTSGAATVAAGGEHACAVTGSGALKCWGANYYGQLGVSSTVSHNAPVDVLGLGAGVATVACGGSGVHTCAARSDGSVQCWGDNGSGQLGDGTTISSTIPVAVVGLPEPVTTLAAGEDHNCAITRSGAVYCWGAGGNGQIGDGRARSVSQPTAVLGLESGARAIASGNVFNCALRDDGAVVCWGDNAWGQLGDGTRDRRYAPGPVHGLPGRAIAIAAGDQHACAVIEGGALYCWGDNSSGQLGANPAWSLTPVDVVAAE